MIVYDCLNLENHFSSKCKPAFFHIRRIARIRKYLLEESTAALVHASLMECLFIYGLPDYLIHRLQSVQNCAARLVKHSSKYAHATPFLL